LPSESIAILDENGNAVVSYGYDAWGAPLWCTGELAETLGKVQPFRYRGYVFDEETGLYYLRSRYYNWDTVRFISCDSILATDASTISKSAFVYCANSPMCAIDSDGALPEWLTGIIAVAAAAVTVVAVVAAAPAAICAATFGLTLAGVGSGTAAAIATIGGYVAATVATTAAIDSAVDVVTGYSPIRDGLLQGEHDEIYEGYLYAGAFFTAGILTLSAMSPDACFVGETPVKVVDGYKEIDRISVGDLVWSENQYTGSICLDYVKHVFVKTTNVLVYLSVDDEIITTTPDHPFYVSDIGWIPARNLSVGCVLRTWDNTSCILRNITYKEFKDAITVYNLEVVNVY